MTPLELYVDNPAETGEYQSLTPWATISLVLGALSPAALAAPLLLVVPVAAVGAGLLALAKIQAADGGLTGTRLARWGMGLGLACIAATLVRAPVRDAMMRQQTMELTRHWITLLAEGNADEALE